LILEQILRWAVPFLCGGLMSAALAYFTFFRVIRNGVQCLLRAEIIRCYKEYEDKHYCPIYAQESLKRMYKAYHALGGNDVATNLYERVLALPTDLPKEDNHE